MKKTILSSLMAAGALAFATSASAAPLGAMSIANCSSGGVRVSATTIDWIDGLGNAGPTDGCINTGSPTGVTYDSGFLADGVTGAIKDLPPVPSAGFMTFAGHPNLTFDLAGLGPGSANFNCNVAIGNSCSIAPGSPFLLTRSGQNTTTVTLTANGLAYDLSGSSIWFGSFTTQLNNWTPLSIQQFFAANPNGFIENTYSGTFDLQFVPEPASMLLLGLGFTAVAVRVRRRR